MAGGSGSSWCWESLKISLVNEQWWNLNLTLILIVMVFLWKLCCHYRVTFVYSYSWPIKKSYKKQAGSRNLFPQTTVFSAVPVRENVREEVSLSNLSDASSGFHDEVDPLRLCRCSQCCSSGRTCHWKAGASGKSGEGCLLQLRNNKGLDGFWFHHELCDFHAHEIYAQLMQRRPWLWDFEILRF